MKLELDAWHRILDLYIKFQNDPPKYVEKSRENFEKNKNTQT